VKLAGRGLIAGPWPCARADGVDDRTGALRGDLDAPAVGDADRAGGAAAHHDPWDASAGKSLQRVVDVGGICERERLGVAEQQVVDAWEQLAQRRDGMLQRPQLAADVRIQARARTHRPTRRQQLARSGGGTGAERERDSRDVHVTRRRELAESGQLRHRRTGAVVVNAHVVRGAQLLDHEAGRSRRRALHA
jgi:hypothetical protein